MDFIGSLYLLLTYSGTVDLFKPSIFNIESVNISHLLSPTGLLRSNFFIHYGESVIGDLL